MLFYVESEVKNVQYNFFIRYFVFAEIKFENLLHAQNAKFLTGTLKLYFLENEALNGTNLFHIFTYFCM